MWFIPRSVLAAIALGAAAPAMAAAAPEAAWTPAMFGGDAAIEAQILALTNAARAEEGLPALASDERLRAAARQHSAEMAELGYFGHTSPVSSRAGVGDRALIAGYVWQAIGENVFYATGLDVTRDRAGAARLAVTGWLNSPGHRANLMSPGFTAIGVGVSVQGRKGFHATQVFGAPGLDLSPGSP